MALIEYETVDGRKIHKYEQPSDEILYDKVSLLLDSLELYVNKHDDLNFENNIVVDAPAVAEIFVRVDKRKDYFIIFHDDTDMNEIKEAALMAYWILKFKPFSVKSEVILTFVGHLLSECSGVYDYTGLTLNGQAENLTVNETDIPIMGEVNLGESG